MAEDDIRPDNLIKRNTGPKSPMELTKLRSASWFPSISYLFSVYEKLQNENHWNSPLMQTKRCRVSLLHKKENIELWKYRQNMCFVSPAKFKFWNAIKHWCNGKIEHLLCLSFGRQNIKIDLERDLTRCTDENHSSKGSNISISCGRHIMIN